MTATTSDRPAAGAPPVPLVDLVRMHRAVEDEVVEQLIDAMGRGAFIGGAAVERFEQAFAEHSGATHCVGVANGTDALELSLRAAGIGAGDEVLVPANTFVATVEAVLHAGATPVLVDVDPDAYLMDPEAAAAAVGPRTAALLPVHLYGQMAPMEQLAALARRHGLALFEDAAQAQGASQHGVPVGHHARAAGTSFYPGKNLGAYGDGGAVLTDDDDLARTVRILGNHGRDAAGHHVLVGRNSRLDALQAIVLEAKLAHLPAWNAERRDAADRYSGLLFDREDVVLPRTVPGNTHVWHLYVVRVPERDRVLADLRAAGIQAGTHYRAAVHTEPAYRDLDPGDGSLRNAEEAASSIVSLPLFPGITLEDQERVVAALASALGSRDLVGSAPSRP